MPPLIPVFINSVSCFLIVGVFIPPFFFLLRPALSAFRSACTSALIERETRNRFFFCAFTASLQGSL